MIVAAGIGFAVPALALDQPVLTDQQRADAIRQLDWLGAGSHRLPASNSTLAVPSGYQAVLGDAARRLATLTGDPADEVEAIAVSSDFEDVVVFQSVNDGYVSIDDWNEVEQKSMLASISENTEKANQERRRQRLEEAHVVGWLQEPTLDRQTNTVFWALEGSTPHGLI